MAVDFANLIKSTGTGAMAGAAVGGPWGAVVGGAVGLLGGAFSEYSAAKDEEGKRAALEKISKLANTNYEETKALLDDYYNKSHTLGTAADADKYRQMVASYDPSKFVYDVDEFADDYKVDDYYAPNRQAIIDKTTDQLQGTAAGAGIGRGTGAANMIATGVADKNEQLYKDALSAMQSDRSFDFQKYQSDINNNQNRLNTLQQGVLGKMNMYQNLGQDYYSAQADELENYLNLRNNRMNQQTNIGMAMASL